MRATSSLALLISSVPFALATPIIKVPITSTISAPQSYPTFTEYGEYGYYGEYGSYTGYPPGIEKAADSLKERGEDSAAATENLDERSEDSVAAKPEILNKQVEDSGTTDTEHMNERRQGIVATYAGYGDYYVYNRAVEDAILHMAEKVKMEREMEEKK